MIEGESGTMRVPGHPLQFAMCGDAYVADSQDMTDEEIHAEAGERNSGSAVRRYEQCPICRRQAPCAARRKFLECAG